MIRQFLHTYLPRYRGWYVVGLVFLLATTAVTITIPRVIGVIVDQLRDPATGLVTVRHTVVHLLWLALLLGLCRTMSRVALFYPGRKIEYAVRQAFFDQLTYLPQATYQHYTVGDLMSRGVNDISAIRIMLSMAILHIINTCVLVVGAVHGMRLLSPALTLWVMGPVLAMFVTTLVAVRFFYRFVYEAQCALGQLSESVRETLGASTLFNTYPIQATLLERFDVWNQAYSRAVQRVATARACVFPLMNTFVGIGALLALWIGGQMVLSHTLTLGALVAFMTYVWILSDPAVAIGWVVNAIQRGHTALKRIGDITAAERTHGVQTVGRTMAAAASLEVRDLCFHYPGFTLVVDRLMIRAGQRVGIFGTTGSGKSTLADLMAGVMAAPAGTVYINGQDQHVVPVSQWRQWVSYVPQQTMLFSASIADNIRMQQPLSMARLAATVDAAALSTDVAGFPQGWSTRVGEGGVTLSGGQRQRVSFARALYHGGTVLIVDDMTSAVDTVTESRLLRHLRDRSDQLLCVMISHRVSTLATCDDIMVLDHGRVVDRGAHDELLTRNALYHGTWDYEQRATRLRGPHAD